MCNRNAALFAIIAGYYLTQLINGIKGKDEEKQKMNVKVTNIRGSEATSQKEVGVQDSLCTITPQETELSAGGYSVLLALDRLVTAVEGVAGKVVIAGR